jgi:hypothetical protein
VLAEEKIVRFPLDQLAGFEAQCLYAGAPPAARGLAAGFAGLDVVTGRVLCRAAVDLLPDVVQVITLAQGRDDCQGLPPQAGGGGTDHDHQMVHGCDVFEVHTSRVTKRPSKIIYSGRLQRGVTHEDAWAALRFGGTRPDSARQALGGSALAKGVRCSQLRLLARRMHERLRRDPRRRSRGVRWSVGVFVRALRR